MDIRAIRSQLTQQLKKLTEQVREGVVALRLDDSTRKEFNGDPYGTASIAEARETDGVILGNREARARSIRNAIRKIDSGGYGLCENCGNAISPARLKTLPETVRCVKCQAVAEKLSKHTPSIASFGPRNSADDE